MKKPAPAAPGADKLVVKVHDASPDDDPVALASKGVADYLLSDNRVLPEVIEFYGELHRIMVGVPRGDDPRSSRLYLPRMLDEGARYIGWAKPAPLGPRFGEVWLIGFRHRIDWQRDTLPDPATGERFVPRERASGFEMMKGGYPRCIVCRKPGNGRADAKGAYCREHS